MTVADAATRERLMSELPDIPGWLETRWMLSLETTELTGLDSTVTSSSEGAADPISLLVGLILAPGGSGSEEGGGFVLRDPPSGFVSVVGRPAATAIAEAVELNERGGDVMSQTDNADHVGAALGGWKRTPAKLHLLADSEKLFGPSGPRTDMFGLPELDDGSDEFENQSDRA
jgi:hypothetical protein